MFVVVYVYVYILKKVFCQQFLKQQILFQWVKQYSDTCRVISFGIRRNSD